MSQHHPLYKSLDFSKLKFDPLRSEVKYKGRFVDLTAQEFKLLYFLASHPDQVWKRSDLICEVWGHDYVGDPRVVDVHIGQLSQKIALATGSEDDLTGGTARSLRPRRPNPPPISDDSAVTPDSF
jgi:DNA-binding response OmpR family regulator